MIEDRVGGLQSGVSGFEDKREGKNDDNKNGNNGGGRWRANKQKTEIKFIISI